MASAATAQLPAAQRILNASLRGTGASAALLGATQDTTLALYGAADLPSAPGSTLKPLILQTALEDHVITDRTTVLCRGDLSIAGHNLACTHPRDLLRMDARLALANSCNTYFAALAERMSASQIRDGLRAYGLVPVSHAETPDQRALLALGVQGILISPQQLAQAYRQLALKVDPTGPVRDGLLQSVDRGMARSARIDNLPTGLTLGGKTGTMHDRSDPFGHGWFAGIVFRDGRATEVLVICLPRGNGADAARLARQILTAQLLPAARAPR